MRDPDVAPQCDKCKCEKENNENGQSILKPDQPPGNMTRTTVKLDPAVAAICKCRKCKANQSFKLQ